MVMCIFDEKKDFLLNRLTRYQYRHQSQFDFHLSSNIFGQGRMDYP